MLFETLCFIFFIQFYILVIFKYYEGFECQIDNNFLEAYSSVYIIVIACLICISIGAFLIYGVFCNNHDNLASNSNEISVYIHSNNDNQRKYGSLSSYGSSDELDVEPDKRFIKKHGKKKLDSQVSHLSSKTGDVIEHLNEKRSMLGSNAQI
jgi:hypothetical protein